MALPEALQRRQKEMSGKSTKSGKKSGTKSKDSTSKPHGDGTSTKPSQSTKSSKKPKSAEVKASASKPLKAKDGKKSTSSQKKVKESVSTKVVSPTTKKGTKDGSASASKSGKKSTGKSKSQSTTTTQSKRGASTTGKKSQKQNSSVSKKKGKGSTKPSKSKSTPTSENHQVDPTDNASTTDIQSGVHSDDDLPEEFEALTAKERTFCIEYAISRNGTEAARIAGYKGKDENSLAVIAHTNLRKVKIQNAMRAYMQPHFERYSVTADNQVRELADIAHSPWRDHITVRMTKDLKVEVKMQLTNKIAALIELNKMMGLYPKDDTGDELRPVVNLHLHKHMTADDARQSLLDYLRKK